MKTYIMLFVGIFIAAVLCSCDDTICQRERCTPNGCVINVIGDTVLLDTAWIDNVGGCNFYSGENVLIEGCHFAGSKTYTTVLGGTRTVRRYTFCPTCYRSILDERRQYIEKQKQLFENEKLTKTLEHNEKIAALVLAKANAEKQAELLKKESLVLAGKARIAEQQKQDEQIAKEEKARIAERQEKEDKIARDKKKLQETIRITEQQKQTYLSSTTICPVCKGTASTIYKMRDECDMCKGTGHTISYHKHTALLCGTCSGNGAIDINTTNICLFCEQGRVAKLLLSKIIMCKKCYGNGMCDGKKVVICISCGGRGEKVAFGKLNSSGLHKMEPCLFCKASGVTYKLCSIVCDECKGLRVVKVP